MKKTNWFPAHVRPNMVGEYEVYRPILRQKNGRTRMLWTGKVWTYRNGGYTNFGTLHEAGNKWRGLAEKPE